MADRATRGGGTTTDLTGAFLTSQNSSVVLASDWFGPGKPMTPTAPVEVTGRGFDFAPNVNMQINSRRFEGIDAKALRNLSRSHDLTRLAIETRKDQLAKLQWTIAPRDKKAKIEGQLQARVEAANKFFKKPDKERAWATWLRLVIEDMLVLDAPTIYRRRTRGGGLYSLKAMDGGTFSRVLDDWGDTPPPPWAAYQQNLRGFAAVNYTTDQIIYRPRNPSTDRRYGISPVEQIVSAISLALQRQAWQISFFQHGNMPDTLIGVPDEWSADQIRKFQEWFDARLEGNFGRRRGGTFVPGKMSVTNTKDTPLFGEAEEWLARVVMYAFNLSPQAFVKMMNRATSETSKDSAEEEGLEPLKQWVKELVDDELETSFFAPDLEFLWSEEEEIDPKVADDIRHAKVADGRMTFNEARAEEGKDPYDLPEASMPGIVTPTGWVPLSGEAQVERATAMTAALPKPAPGGFGGGDDKKPAPPKKEKVTIRAFGKSDDGMAQDRPLNRRVEKAMTKTVAAALQDCGDDVAAQVSRALKAQKAAGDFDIDALIADLDLSALDNIVPDVTDDLNEIFTDTMAKALVQVGVTSNDALVNVVNDSAVEFARTRAAELVGKKWTEDGELIDNPNAKWAITDSTRNMLRATITQGLEDNIGTPAIAEAIQASTTFSKARAENVAFTEVANANEQAKLGGWRTAGNHGVVVKKKWFTAGGDACDVCLSNQAQGFITLNANFQSGRDAPPQHGRTCRCVLISEVQK